MSDENKNNKSVVLTAIFAIVIFLNVLFVLCFLFFMGFLVGKIENSKTFLEGMEMGREKGRYEVYLELERRHLGYYRVDDDSFVFKEENKE